MDIKLVIKALQLNDEEWEEHLDLINRLRVLTDAEQAQLFSALEPQKKSTKKPAGKGGGGDRCGHVYGSGVTCNLMPAATVHVSTNHIDHHPFQSSKKPASKSARGESLAKQISNRAQSPIQPPVTATIVDDDDDDNSGRCQAKRGDDRICMLLPDHNIHHLPTAMDYHEFVAPPAAHAATGD